MGYQKLSKEQELVLVEEYKQGVSVQSLMTKYGFATKKSITDKIKKHYPNEYDEIIQEARKKRKDYSYSLEKITNDFDAYFIGLLLTDGYVARDREIGIDLTDEDCISFLSKTIGKEYKTYLSSPNTKTDNPLPKYRLILSDIKLVQDIARFGIIPNKSNILQGPKLFEEEWHFLPYIIRGIIDGDGCVFSTSYGAPAFYITTKSQDFANWLVNVLTNKLYMKDIRLTTNREMYRIETANQNNILKLITLVYDKPYGMSRKYLKLRKMFRDYNSDLLLEEDGIVQTTTNNFGLGNQEQ